MYMIPIKMCDPKVVRQLKLICHPELRNGIGASKGFQIGGGQFTG